MKQAVEKKSSTKRSSSEYGGLEETEIAAQITLATDGGWGWVVLIASFFTQFVTDGIICTFGALLIDISQDLNISVPVVATVGSIQYTLNLVVSPLAAALINRMGFRMCGMIGSIVCSFGILASHFSMHFGTFLMFYAFVFGFGSSFMSLASYLVVGFYFEKFRSLALVLVTTGASLGIMLMFPLNLYLCRLAGWRPTVLVQSALCGLVYFFSLTYRPLVTLTITTEENYNPTRTVTYLPSLIAPTSKPSSSTVKVSPTERLLHTLSTPKYPTASSALQNATTATASTAEDAKSSGQSTVSRITLSTSKSRNNTQVKQVQNMTSEAAVSRDGAQQSRRSIEIAVVPAKSIERKSVMHWSSEDVVARPMYRDDIFYEGDVKTLPVYQNNKTSIEEMKKFEYQLAVTRTATVNDIKEKKSNLCGTAVRRVLASMLHTELLKKTSFQIFCLSGLFSYVGFSIPLTYLQDRNEKAGVDHAHCAYFVSVLGICNGLGRIFWGCVALKVNPLKIYVVCLMAAGISTIMSSWSYTLLYQYAYSAFFGGTICVTTGMRTVILVNLYGLEHLTNAMGLFLVFLGIGSLFSAPVGGLIRDRLGYAEAFYFAGASITLSGLIAIPVSYIAAKENARNG